MFLDILVLLRSINDRNTKTVNRNKSPLCQFGCDEYVYY